MVWASMAVRPCTLAKSSVCPAACLPDALCLVLASNTSAGRQDVSDRSHHDNYAPCVTTRTPVTTRAPMATPLQLT